MQWLAHGLAFGSVAITLAISYLGPQAFVGHQNLARAVDPALVAPGGWSGFDADHAIALGDDAVPELVAALGRLESAERATVLQALTDRRTALDVNPAFDHWAAWNLSRTRAREVLVAPPDR